MACLIDARAEELRSEVDGEAVEPEVGPVFEPDIDGGPGRSCCMAAVGGRASLTACGRPPDCTCAIEGCRGCCALPMAPFAAVAGDSGLVGGCDTCCCWGFSSAVAE